MVGAGVREYPLTIAYVTLTATDTNDPAPGRVDHLLATTDRALIAGEAGSGKTTLLQWLTVRAAKRDHGQLSAWNQRTPFYVSLRDYAETDKQFPAAQRVELWLDVRQRRFDLSGWRM